MVEHSLVKGEGSRVRVPFSAPFLQRYGKEKRRKSECNDICSSMKLARKLEAERLGEAQ